MTVSQKKPSHFLQQTGTGQVSHCWDPDNFGGGGHTPVDPLNGACSVHQEVVAKKNTATKVVWAAESGGDEPISNDPPLAEWIAQKGVAIWPTLKR